MHGQYPRYKFEETLVKNSRGRARDRTDQFCQRFGLRVPILAAPMAGAFALSLAAAVANAGGMGPLGAVTTRPDGIRKWRETPAKAGDVNRMQMWAGQAAAFARDEPAADLARQLWEEAQTMLPQIKQTPCSSR